MYDKKQLIEDVKRGYCQRLIHFSDFDSVFSPWFKSKFTEQRVKREFKSIGQYLTYEKARRYRPVIMQQVLETNDKELLMEMYQSMGGEEDKDWEEERLLLLTYGNYYKFSQNDNIKKELFDTKGSVLSYCSPANLQWSNGLKIESISKDDPSTWKGDNELGFVLGVVRAVIKEEEDNRYE